MAKTWGTLRDEIQRETNIVGEDFVSETELLSWANDARDEAEAEIVSLHDKYLETEGYLTLVEGEDIISLPTDIYATKITGIHYSSTSGESYEIDPIKKKAQIFEVNDNDDYRYRIINQSGVGNVIKLYPAAREDSTENVVIFYIRESQPLTTDSSVMDLPIAEGFIKQYVKDKIKEKEVGPMNVEQESPLLRKQRELMLEALSDMIPDDNGNEIQADYWQYEEQEF